MLDIKWVRSNPEKLKEIIRLKKVDPTKADVDKFLELDLKRLNLIKETEDLSKERNEIASKVPSATNDEKTELVNRGKVIKEKFATLEQELNSIEKEWMNIQLWFPNLMHPDMPIGENSDDNVEVRGWRPDTGELLKDELGKGEFSSEFMPDKIVSYKIENEFTLTDHVEIGEKLNGIDLKQSAIVSGSRFAYLSGDIARLQFALEQYFTNELFSRGFELLIPPVLVKERVLYGTSHFPGDADQVYSLDSGMLEDPSGKLYLVGSSEAPNFAYFMDRVLTEKELPRKMFATTHCFRSEVGSWGKDVRGLKRVHQFDKLELDIVCKEDESDAIFDELISINEWLLQKLKLPYHIINMCTGDAGYYATAKKYDWEVWLPSQKKYMELGSCTNAYDYQARRMNIKYKTSDGETKFVHTVNDTGIAFGRMIIAIIDNYQTSDKKVIVPEVLRSIMGKDILE
jgi:seryl-tRNA synthetase